MDKIKKGLTIFQNIELCIAVILFVIFFVPNIFGLTPYAVKSGSMEPTIKTGSMTYVNQNYEVKKIKKDDIIAFGLKDNTFVTHRVYEVHDDYFITKGDANKTPDARYVYHQEYKGKIIFSLPYVGYLPMIMQKKLAYVIIGIIIALNVGISVFINVKSKKSSETKGDPELKDTNDISISDEPETSTEESDDLKASDSTESSEIPEVIEEDNPHESEKPNPENEVSAIEILQKGESRTESESPSDKE